jgi:hypothetical protein
MLATTGWPTDRLSYTDIMPGPDCRPIPFTDPSNPIIDIGDEIVWPRSAEWGKPRTETYRRKCTHCPYCRKACTRVGAHAISAHHKDAAWFDMAYCGGGRTAWRKQQDRAGAHRVFAQPDDNVYAYNKIRLETRADTFCKFTGEIDEIKRERLKSLQGLSCVSNTWPPGILVKILRSSR